jgi:hypothetical protein
MPLPALLLAALQLQALKGDRFFQNFLFNLGQHTKAVYQ